MMRKTTIILLLLAVTAVPALAGVAADHYNRGNQLYAEKKIAEALESYEAALSAGADDPDLYLNLGNAAFRLGDVGLAIWSYEMGLRLAPRDGDLRFNLRYAEAFTRDELPPTDQVFLLRAARAVALWLRPTEAVLAAALGWLLVGLAVLLWGPWRNRRGWVIVIGVVGLLILILFAPIAGWRVHDQLSVDKAVVTTEEATVHTAPTLEAGEAFVVHGGMRLELVEQRDRFTRVRIPTGLEGWIESETYRELLP